MASLQVVVLMQVGGIIAAIPGGLIIQGLVDILQDIGSGFKWCFVSNKGHQISSNAQGSRNNYAPAPTGESHPATAHCYSNPVFGAGEEPAAASLPASPAPTPAPSFGMGSSAGN